MAILLLAMLVGMMSIGVTTANPGEMDVAHKSSCSASTVFVTHGNFTCERAIDGNAGSDYASAGEGIGLWFRLDLDQTYHVLRLRIMDRFALIEKSKDLLLTFSDGSKQVVNFPTPEDGSHWSDFPITPVWTHSVIITVISVYSTYNNGFTEIEVYADLDECALKTASCDVNAGCVNTPGSYTCTCFSGFTGDGLTCTDLDECVLKTASCDVNAVCVNTSGSYTCTCFSGFTGDGLTCTESDSIIKSIIIAVSVCGPVLLFTVLWVCCRKRRQLKRKEKDQRNRTNGQSAPSTDIKFIEDDTTAPSQKQIMPLQIGSVLKIILDQESQWKIHGLLLHPNKLETSDKVGQGALGTVYKGHYRPDSNPMNCKEVAVKTLKDTCVYPEITAFMEEAIVMSDFRHMNVLSIIGVCIRLDTEIPMIVLPYMALGDLQHYCRQFRYDDKMKNKVPELPQLMSFSLQIARGMDYLAGLKFVHRDVLAARNCMLDRDMVVKVADFGLTRDVYSNSYYRQDKQKLLPIKWMALESLQDRVFTTYTDVWSYGVTVWEMFTLAKVPYPALENSQIVEALGKGVRLLRPNSCPENVYEVIEKCWNENPKERPSFAKICQELEKVLSQFSEYLDLEESPKAVSEPTIDPVQNLSETNETVL